MKSISARKYWILWIFPLLGLTVWAGTVLLLNYRIDNAEETPFPKGAPDSRYFQKISQIPISGRLKDVYFKSPYLYVALGLDGFAVYDCSDLRSPRPIRRWEGRSLINPLDIEFARGKLFVADRFRGLVVLNIDDPEHPEIINEIAVPGIATNLTIREDLLLLSLGSAGLSIYSIDNPAAPIQIGAFNQAVDYVKDAAITEDLLYLADNLDGGLKIVSLNGNGKTRLINQINYGEYCDSLKIIDDEMYINFREGGVIKFSLERPKKPQPMFQIGWHGDAAMDFVVLKQHILVAYYYRGLVLYAMQEGVKPIIAAEQKIGQRTLALFQKEDIIFAGDSVTGVSIFTIREQDTYNPVLEVSHQP